MDRLPRRKTKETQRLSVSLGPLRLSIEQKFLINVSEGRKARHGNPGRGFMKFLKSRDFAASRGSFLRLRCALPGRRPISRLASAHRDRPPAMDIRNIAII